MAAPMPREVLLRHGVDERMGIAETLRTILEINTERGILHRPVAARQPEDEAVVRQMV